VQSNPFLRLVVLLLIALLAGCAGAPDVRERVPGEETARALAAKGEFRAAAEAYLAAAEASDELRRRAELRLAAARTWLRAAELARAEQILRNTVLPGNAADLRLESDLLLAEIALGRSQPGRALQRLPATVPDSLPIDLRRQLLDLRARALLDSGDALDSVRERLLLTTLLDGGEAELANQVALLGALRNLGPALPDPNQVEPALAGWIALARLASGPPRHAVALEGELAEWRTRHPDHPARPELLERLLAERAAVPTPSSIAVLLPLRGPLAGAASAIRDGFLAALYADPEAGFGNAPNVTVRFYDSSSDALGAYGEAVTDGAESIVGPLRKEAVAELAAIPLPVPVLALNRLAEQEVSNGFLRQFALAPEDEAIEVADRAWLDGHRQMVVLTPTTDFGQRVAAAFRDRWESLGGRLLETWGYDPGQNDFSEPITALLGLTASESRYRALRGALGRSLEFEPRRRRDADAVFLAALPRQARLLKPQLAFHHAADLPVYATSHVFAPGTQAEADRDLNGLRFCDMPWTLGAMDATLAGGLPTAVGASGRLFALGADAYGLLPYLARLQADPGSRLDAQTGLLWLDERGIVHRQLLCAEFAEGQPNLLGYTPPPRPVTATPVASE
jgi:outer membrane PBP1 activator LpoA protein